jgi:hypothetical protein
MMNNAFLDKCASKVISFLVFLGIKPTAFDSLDRNLDGGASHLISQFDYLNTSNRVEADKVRRLIDRFLWRYPKSERGNLRNRLRSIDDDTHRSAFFELAMHELIVRAGCKVIAVEPELQVGTRRPDFLAETRNGERFYLEATLATGRTQEDNGAQARLNRALAAIDGVNSPDFFLDLTVGGMPAASVSTRRLRHELREWLRDIDYEDVVARWRNGCDSVLPFSFEQHGMMLTIRPVPRHRTRGEADGRAIGAHSLRPFVGQPHAAIRRSLENKAGRYGNLDLPYVIAVNALPTFSRERHVTDALFGTEAVVSGETENGFSNEWIRQTDGLWRDENGPRYTRVSAVIAVERFDAWHLAQRRARIYHNPWARRDASFLDFGIDKRIVQNEQLVSIDGNSMSEIFNIHSGWPE